MTQLHPLQHRIGIVTSREDRGFRFPAPTTVCGLYHTRRKKYFRQTGEWGGVFSLAEGATERRIRFKDKTVRVYEDAQGRQFWTYVDHQLSQWLVMTPEEVLRCQRFLAANAAHKAQKQAEENLESYKKAELVELAQRRGLSVSPKAKKDEIIEALKAA